MHAARKVAELFHRISDFQGAWNMLSQAMDLLPTTHVDAQGHADQQFVVSELPGLSAEACSTALSAGVDPLRTTQSC
jgi:hypothetical protein